MIWFGSVILNVVMHFAAGPVQIGSNRAASLGFQIEKEIAEGIEMSDGPLMQTTVAAEKELLLQGLGSQYPSLD